VDNRRLLQGLTGASDRRHADMVNSQYARWSWNTVCFSNHSWYSIC
jgi:hypothetical protein